MIDTAKLTALLVSAVGIVLFGIAIGMAAQARRAKNSETMKTGVNVFGVMIVMGLATLVTSFGIFGLKLLRMVGFDV